MNNSQQIADIIRVQATSKKISIKQMLKEIGLGINTLSHLDNGSMPKADNLAKIADYLNCSVDYLLGRTDNSERYSGDNITIGDTNGNYNMTIAKGESKQLQIDGLSKEMLEKFDALDFDKKVEVMALIADLSKK